MDGEGFGSVSVGRDAVTSGIEVSAGGAIFDPSSIGNDGMVNGAISASFGIDVTFDNVSLLWVLLLILIVLTGENNSDFGKGSSFLDFGPVGPL